MIEVTYKFEELASCTRYKYAKAVSWNRLDSLASDTPDFPVIIDTDGAKYKAICYSNVEGLTLGSLALTPAGIFSTLELVHFGFDPKDVFLVVEKIA